LKLAAELDADLIVLGTHGRHGFAHKILGSVTDEVMQRATCGVFVIGYEPHSNRRSDRIMPSI